MFGVVTGLLNGKNVLVVRAGNSKKATRLTITNHPIGGPVIAGRRQLPFVCATPTPQPATLARLGHQCQRAPYRGDRRAMQHRNRVPFLLQDHRAGLRQRAARPSPPAVAPANTCFKPFTPGQPAPADSETTTTDLGITVPYIVRVERGTIDRGIFDIAVLFDPAQDWKPWAPQAAWNGKVVHSFGASTGQPRRQFRSEQSWVDDSALSRGFMVVDNSMTDTLFN